MEKRNLDYNPQRLNQSITHPNDDGVRSFSITDLAPLNQRHPPVYQPPTPPPDDDDSEAMDWTPSQENRILRPTTSYRTSNAVSQQPQPLSYRERFPSNAANQSHSLRNPPNQPMFRKGFQTRDQESFQTPMKYAMRDSSHESPFATPYEHSLASGSPDLSPIKFAQPKFFPHTDREELGLESLMATSFSLAEEPHEVRARQRLEKRETETHSKLDGVYARWHGPAALLLLAISCTVWTSAPIPSLATFRMQFRMAALCITALVILKPLLLAIGKDSDRSISDIVLLAFELATTVVFGAALRHRAATIPSEDSTGPLEKPGIILIVALIAQEAWMLYSGTWVHRRSNGDVPSPPVPQPTAVPDSQRVFSKSSMSSSRPGLEVDMETLNSQHLPASSQRTTRSRTKQKSDSRAQGGFSNLSLGGNARNEQALGMNSLKLEQPRGRNRNGMW